MPEPQPVYGQGGPAHGQGGPTHVQGGPALRGNPPTAPAPSLLDMLRRASADTEQRAGSIFQLIPDPTEDPGTLYLNFPIYQGYFTIFGSIILNYVIVTSKRLLIIL